MPALIRDSEKRKWLCRALRFIAHTHRCSLVMTSVQEKATLGNFKALMSHFLFATDNAAQSERDHLKAVCIAPGDDSLAAIGDPKVGLGSDWVECEGGRRWEHPGSAEVVGRNSLRVLPTERRVALCRRQRS